MNTKAIQLLIGLTLVLLLGMGLRHLGLSLIHPAPLEYGEGVSLYWSQQAASGADLYPTIHEEHLPWLHNPYTPLYSILSSKLQKLLPQPHPLFAGRVLSLLGLLLSCTAIFALARRELDRFWAGFASLLFLLNPVLLQHAVLMRPDLLALGCSLWSVQLCLGKPNAGRFALAAGLATLAFWSKQSYITALLLLGFRLIQRKQPRLLLPMLGSLLGISLLCMLHPSLRNAGATWQHLVTLHRLPWSGARMLELIASWGGLQLFWIALGAGCVCTRPHVLKAYALFALIPPLLSLGIAGSGEAYLLELSAILLLTAVSLLPGLMKKNPQISYLLLLLQLLLMIPLQPAPVFTRTYGQELSGGSGGLTPGQAERDLSRTLISELQRQDSPLLSSSPGYALLSEHDLQLQVFQFGTLMQSGAWSAETLQQLILNHDFACMLLQGNAEEGLDPYLPAELQELIHREYTLSRVLGPWHVYLRP